MKKHIPNLITSLNVICGSAAVFLTMYGRPGLAALLIVLGMVFDFFDGLTARLLHVKSEIGKELDSLADMVSFGLAPALLAHWLMMQTLPGHSVSAWADWTMGQQIFFFLPLLIPAFSAYRLAKFNLDTRQTVSFIGMPTPANALFWVGLVFAFYQTPIVYTYLFANTWVLGICMFVLSVLLISEIPMFSLKISGFGWKGNEVRYLYLASLLILSGILGKAVIPCIIPLYLLFSIAAALTKAFTTSNLK